MSADDRYEQENDRVGGDVPAGDTQDDDYKSRTGQNQVPVQSDGAPIDDPIDPETADSDEQLNRDDNEAIDKSNIINERTRHAGKPKGTYREPGDEEGIPTDDGTSSN